MLPIFAITGRSVWFVLSNALTLFRLTWLPISVLIAAGYGLAYGVVREAPGLDFEAIAETNVFTAAVFAELLLQGLALSVVAVAVHKIILHGDRRPGVYFAFPFGRTELTYVTMGALTIAAIYLLAFVLFVGPAMIYSREDLGASASAFLAAPMAGATTALVIVAAFVTCVAVIWLSLRLMVWPPAVVANNRLSLGEAWTLSRGNALALLGLSVASGLVFFVIGAGILMAAARIDGAPEILGVATDAEFDVSFEDKIKRLLAGRVAPQIVAFEFAFQFFVTTYAVAVLSYAYKALKGFDADLPINQQPDFGADLPSGEKALGAL